ncbi:hypothetical protein BDV93DRAFT_564519 [Ceratobasidium sp. AG-I]|nr:hypothetical protein BDV93DRAFT_564519 [Ceratobasidium sp. AG-I]
MPSAVPATSLNSTKYPPTALPTPPSRSLSQALQSERTSVQPRRSARARRPSVHKLESNEYQASSQPPSRAATPAGTKSKPESKKRASGKRGKRAGRITQPDNNAGTSGDDGSPKPSTTSRSKPGNAFLASQGSVGDTLVVVDKAEAIRRATTFLGADASHLSNRTLQQVLAQIAENDGTAESDSMEFEGGSAPTILQSTNQLVLGSRHQPPAKPTSNALSHTQEDVALAQEESRLDDLFNPDTATESESESEIVELAPGDSVSQRFPPVLPFCLIPPTSPHILVPETLPTPHCATSIPFPNDLDMELDGSVVAEAISSNSNPGLDSDLDPELQSDLDSALDLSDAPAKKRLRLTLPPRQTRPARSRLSYHKPHVARLSASASMRHSSIHSTTLGGMAAHPLPRTAPSPAVSTTIPNTLSANHRPPSALSLDLSKPPPTSDIGAVLAWATRIAAHAAQPLTRTGKSRDGDVSDSANGAYKALAEVLGNLGNRFASSAPKPQHGAHRSPSSSRHTDFVEDNAGVLEAEAALALGKHVPSSQKFALSDFPGLRRRIASIAIPELIALACATGAYETFGTLCCNPPDFSFFFMCPSLV